MVVSDLTTKGARWCVFALFLLLAFFTAERARAVTPNCLPDCYTDTLQGPYLDTICVQPPNCPTCVRIEITFYKRIACSTYYDVQVTNIKSIDPVYSECSGLTIPPAYYFQQALLGLMTHVPNKTGFPPTINGQCVTTWRITMGACQRIEGHNPDPTHPSWWQLQITSCDEDVCCLTPFKVCLVNGVRTATPLGSTSPQSTCPVANPDTWDPDERCYQVCGWADWNIF